MSAATGTGLAGDEGMAPLRAVARAIRKTIDMFVMGK